MVEYSSHIKQLSDKESKHNLYEEKILGVPVWRILRFKTRTKLLKTKTDFNNKSNKKSVRLIVLLKYYFVSLYKIIKLIISNKTYKNVVFAFPRLAYLDGVYLDKFTDPIIQYSKIKENVLIFQKSLSGNHFKPRNHNEYVIESDFIDFTTKVLGIILSPCFALFYGKKIIKLYKKANSIFQLPKSFIVLGIIDLGEFYIKYHLSKIIFKRLKSKNLFIVNRGAFMSIILGAHKANAKVFEIQHGVTMADTILYTGEYHPLIDPDYFLTFGKKWIGPQFYMPMDKLINIGWAFKKKTLKLANEFEENSNDILIISSPGCTFKLFSIIVEMAEKYPQRNFCIRLHPQEAYKQEQLSIIRKTSNIHLESNRIDSAIIVNLYEHIMGDNSSVLFEALCAGKKVARIDMGGLDIKDEGGIPQKGFYYLKNMEDFENYLSDESPVFNTNLGIYDDFKEKTINQLIE